GSSSDAYTALLDTAYSLGGETATPSLGITYGDLTSETVLAYQNLPSLGGPILALRARISGSTMQAKVWPYGQPEPSSWQVTANHSALTRGYIGFSVPTSVQAGDNLRSCEYDVRLLYVSVGTAGDPAVMPPELVELQGAVAVVLSADGALRRRQALAVEGGVQVDARGRVAARLSLSGAASMAVDMDGRMLVDVMEGVAGIAVGGQGHLAGRWALAGQAAALVGGGGRLVTRKAVYSAATITVDAAGDVRGAHLPLGAAAPVAMDAQGVMAARVRLRSQPLAVALPTFGNLLLYRFASPYPPQIHVIQRVSLGGPFWAEQVVAVLGLAPGACPYTEAVHLEQLYGPEGLENQTVQHTLTLTVPGDHPDAAYVQAGNLLVFRDLDGNFQAFEIRRTEAERADALRIRVQATHVMMELADEWIDGETTLPSATAQEALAAILQGTLWEPGIVEDLGQHQITVGYQSVLEALTHFVQVFRAELAFRVEFSGQQIIRRRVDAFVQRGSRRGKRFEARKDLRSIRRTVDDTELKTALYGYGKEDEAGNRVTFEGVEWEEWRGHPTDKPLGQRWVGDPQALGQWGRSGRHRFGVYEDSEETDPVRLLEKTWARLQELKEPKVTYEIDALELERLAGYRHETIRIGDTVSIVDPAFQPPLRVQGRVVQIERDLLDPRQTKVLIGNYLPSIFPALVG
ncbi:MAG: phage tail protein, partial [Bacillota bacterium]